MTEKDNTKTYTVLVTETLTTQGKVTVTANNPEEARELAEDQFDCADYDDGTRETQSMIIEDDGPTADVVAEHPPVIFAYSRREAIDDGVLIDVTKTATELGFRTPVAVTAAVWVECVAVPPGVTGQDERGRLCDVLWMMYVAIRASGGSEAEIRFRLHVRNDNRNGEPPPVELKAVCGPDDDGTLCVTIMTPEED